MVVYFQGTEKEDFILTNTGSIGHSTTDGTYNSTNVRCSISVLPVTSSTYMTTPSFSSNDFWTHFVASWNGANLISGIAPITIIWYSGSTACIGLKLEGGIITLKYWNGSSWITLATTTQFNPDRVLLTYDVYIKIGTVGTGEIRVYVNGIPAVYTNSFDTTFSGTVSAITSLRLTSGSDNGSYGGVWYSEVIVADWNTLGSRVQTLVPDASGTYAAWSNSAYTAVDEITIGNDLISSNTVNQRFSTGYSNVSALTATESIKAVKITGAFTKDLTGPQSVDFFARIGGTDYDGTDQTVPTATNANSTIFQYWANSPSTSTDWSVVELNATEFGVRSRT